MNSYKHISPRFPVWIFILLLALTIDHYCQQEVIVNKWIKPGNTNSINNILVLVNSMEESVFFDSANSAPNYLSGTTCYWNGSQWVFEQNVNSISNIGIWASPGNSGNIIIGAPLNQQGNDYDVFAGEGWVRIKTQIQYLPDTDKLYYDEANNRFILLKGNEPWIYNLE